jgi:hypothetical protein
VYDSSSSPPGMPLLATSPAPATVIMGPGARGAPPSSSYGPSAAGAGFGGGNSGSGGYPGAAAAPRDGSGGGGGGAGLGWEPMNRVMAGLIADAREINELCRCVESS